MKFVFFGNLVDIDLYSPKFYLNIQLEVIEVDHNLMDENEHIYQIFVTPTV